MEELISIIVPIYNSEKFLCKCIDSIINQTYKNLEIILINDGSTDSSGKLCDELAKKDSRIKVIHKENTGVSNTRNIGLDISNGNFVMFVDSDDFLDVDYIEKMYFEIKKNNYTMLISGITYCDEKENIIKKEVYADNSKELKYENIKTDIINTIYFCSACKTLFDKKFLDQNLIRFKENLKFGEDFNFSNKSLKNSKKIGYLNITGYYYRKNNESATNKADEKTLLKYVCDNIEIFSDFDDNENIVANRIYTKINLALRRSVSSNKYKDFISIVQKIMDAYEESKISKKIDIDSINYESKLNKILLKILKKKRYRLYYVIIKLVNFIKK